MRAADRLGLLLLALPIALAAQEQGYIGSDKCLICHEDTSAGFPSNPHAVLSDSARWEAQKIACESCHGPALEHVEALDPAKLDWVDWPTDMDSRFIDAEGLMAWAGKGHSISPAGAGLNLYLDPDGFLPAPAVPGIELRRLDAKADWELIKGLLDACSEEEVDDAEIYEDDPDAEVFGGFAEGRLVGYAGFRYWEEKFADIGILCNPEFRQRGLGKCLVSALSEWCLDNDVVPMYRVDPENTGSRRIAEALGFTMWVRIDVLNFVDREGS